MPIMKDRGRTIAQVFDKFGAHPMAVRMRVQKSRGQREEMRQPLVIGIHEGDQSPTCGFEAGIACDIHALIGLFDVADARVQRLDPGACAVGRAIVDHDQLPIPVRLHQDTGHGASDHVHPVECWQNYRYINHLSSSLSPIFRLSREPDHKQAAFLVIGNANLNNCCGLQ